MPLCCFANSLNPFSNYTNSPTPKVFYFAHIRFFKYKGQRQRLQDLQLPLGGISVIVINVKCLQNGSRINKSW